VDVGATDLAGTELDAVVLAGGQAARLGGVDKPALRVGAVSLLGTVLTAAAAAGAARIVVVGPDRPSLTPRPAGLRVVREDPPGGGPVPALVAGLAEVSAPWLLLLAADLPFLRPEPLAALLAAARRAEAPGAVLADDGGRPQWLLSCWRTGALRQAAALPGGALPAPPEGHPGAGRRSGGSLHGLLGPLRPAVLSLPAGPGPPPWLDCDTPADVHATQTWSTAEPGLYEPASSQGRTPR